MTSRSEQPEVTMSEMKVARDTLLEMADRVTSSASMEEQLCWLNENIADDVAEQLALPALPEDFLLSVVMPVFNEVETVERVVQRVLSVPLPIELVIVDDCSSDGTRELLEQMDAAHPEVAVLQHNENQGKGGALKTGFQAVSGTHVVIQDADMEYDPRDYFALLQPIISGIADVTFGNRFNQAQHSSPWWHRKGNGAITWFSNRKTGQHLTDVETCYKMFRREVLDEISQTLREKGFGIEIEITAKLAKLADVRILEVPVSYDKRSYAEGKKIGWRDGVWALWCILRY